MGVKVESRGDTVVAEIVESISIDEAFGLLDSMAELAHGSATRRGLIVIDEASALLGTLDRHKLGIHAARFLRRTTGLPVGAPIRIITAMCENTARSRGLRVKVFDNVTDAEAWLPSD